MFCICVLLGITETVYGSIDSTENNNNTSEALVSSHHQNQDAIEVLLVRNELLEENNKNMLLTMQWALGLAGMFVIGFLGFTGYFSNRRYQQDKETLEVLVQSESSQIELGVTNELQDRLLQIEHDLHDQTEKLRNSLDERTEEKVAEAVEPILIRLAQSEKEILCLHGRREIEEARRWEEKGVLGNAITCLIDYLNIANRVDNEFWQNEALTELLRLFEKGAELGVYGSTKLHEYLEDIPSKYEELVNRVKRIMR